MLESDYQWNVFVEIGNKIHDLDGVERLQESRTALELAQTFHESNVHMKSEDRYELYEKLLSKLALYWDSDISIMQNAVGQYFHTLHIKAGLADSEWKSIVWDLEQSRIETGFCCILYHNTSRETRYFVSKYLFGPICGSDRCPNLKEYFVSKLLQYIGIGPEAHFLYPLSSSFKSEYYVVTKEMNLALLSDLTQATANMTALLQIDLISRIFCLRDCSTDSRSCGQVGEQPAIVYFRIDAQSGEYSKPDILRDFYDGKGYEQFYHPGLIRSAVQESKNDLKEKVIKQSLIDWNLGLNIDKAVADSIHLKTISEGVIFENDWEKYIEGVKKTIEVLEALG